MISTPDRREAVELINTARKAGARQAKACELLHLSVRTYQRWTRQGDVSEDGRPHAQRAAPSHRLTEAEREQIILRLYGLL